MTDQTRDVDGAVYRCEYCCRAFNREDWLALHRGLDHRAELTPEERAAYEDAEAVEQEALRMYQYKALAALVVLYFGFLMLFAFVRTV